MPTSNKKNTPENNKTVDSPNTGALSKTLNVLEMTMASSPSPSAAAITDALNLPRPTTNRIISNLIRLGFLKRDVKQRQVIEGDRLLKLALSILTRAAQRGPRHEILRELSLQTEETCNVGTIIGGRVQYVDRVESQWPLSLRLEPGSTIPLHCTAMGKLLLSHLPPAHQEKYLSTLSLKRYTNNTITDAAKLRVELDAIAASGVAIDTEEFLSGVNGMAVAIPNGDKFPIMAIAIAAPSARVTPTELHKELPYLRAAAEKLALCY